MFIKMSPSLIMKQKSHKYTDEEDGYINTTQYDKDANKLDIGFQRLKIFSIKQYHGLTSLKILIADNNHFTTLPSPSVLANLQELHCSHNNLKSIPFYPNLTLLNVSRNKITNLNDYHNSILKYLDCSFNRGIDFRIHLPQCKRLFVNDTDLHELNVRRFPTLEFLDCSNNSLKQIDSTATLLELSAQHNKFTSLPTFPNLRVLMIDNNFLTNVMTYPHLTILSASKNNLTKISSQPLLTKISASHNRIAELGSMPNLEIVELDNNYIGNVNHMIRPRHICLQFNPINKFELRESAFQNLEELHVDYKLYEKIYAQCSQYVKTINFSVCEAKIDEKNKKLAEIFNARTLQYIKKKFIHTDFKDRVAMFTTIVMRIKDEYFAGDSEKVAAEKSVVMLKNISKLYHKTLVAALIFN